MADLRADFSPPDATPDSGERRTAGDLVRAGRERAAEQAQRALEREGRARARHDASTEG
jgi:hypothetical protein